MMFYGDRFLSFIILLWLQWYFLILQVILMRILLINKQPGFTIDYRNGDVYSDNPLSLSGKRLGNNIYVINRDTNRFHKESCACVCDIKNKRYFVGEKQTIEEEYCKCGHCIC